MGPLDNVLVNSGQSSVLSITCTSNCDHGNDEKDGETKDETKMWMGNDAPSDLRRFGPLASFQRGSWILERRPMRKNLAGKRAKLAPFRGLEMTG